VRGFTRVRAVQRGNDLSVRLKNVFTAPGSSDHESAIVEVHKVHLEGGDRVLLCSDGLTEMVPEEEINQIVQSEAEPEQACRRLVRRANEAGGKDNITVVVAHFRTAKTPEQPEEGVNDAAISEAWRLVDQRGPDRAN
jgi:serine/threonine protein phosphatase PrpC